MNFEKKKSCIIMLKNIMILLVQLTLVIQGCVINEVYGREYLNEAEMYTAGSIYNNNIKYFAKEQWIDENTDDASAAVSGDVNNLYALSACLIDGDTGRILFEKDGFTRRANASTTKIMTCILALEYGNLDDIITVSKYAAGMPDVQLNIKEGEKYRLGDLLYSLMLESHNDVAVAIAEHIAGDVKTFAAMMNEKARELGCYDTYFITPNGLDATETIDGKDVFHGTTAADLAKIMSYCIKNEEFLKITRTSSYTFSNKVVVNEENKEGQNTAENTGKQNAADNNGSSTINHNINMTDGNRIFTVNNKNAFLNMMDGALSGKTGFTGAAGYCYVGALKRDDKTFVVALLGCGWPNNKNYKWSDTKALFNYGLENYSRKDLFEYDMMLGQVTVTGGKTKNEERENIIDNVKLDLYIEEAPVNMLVREEDKVEKKLNIKRNLKAPVMEKQIVGNVEYYLNGEIIKAYPVYVKGNVEKLDYEWCLLNTVKKFLMLE